MRGRLRRTVTALVAAAAALTVSGCEGAYDLPLPGGAAGGTDVYRVTIEFADVLDLVPQSAVKVNDVTVGAVEGVRLRGWHAEVRVRLLDSVKLPDDAVAELRQTSLLGEKFVSLSPPAGGGTGRLRDGDVIPLTRSGRNPEVEEVLGALSLVLNGGGVAQLKTINVELARAMRGHEADIKGAIRNLTVFMQGLDAQKTQLVRAIDGLDRLAARLAAQKEQIGTAIDDLGPGLKVLADQRKQLTQMLTALSQLGEIGTRVIRASRDDTLANLRALEPILTRLDEAGADLPYALEMLVTYPFPQAATAAVKGDYTNLRVTADLDLRTVLTNLNGGKDPGLPTLPPLPNPGPLPTTLPSSLPTSLPTSLPAPSGAVTSLPTSVPVPVPTAGSSGGGGTCVLGICIGAGARTAGAYDLNLAQLMLGGLL